MKPASTSALPPNIQFYRRTLPTSCVSFGSEEGKALFKDALLTGYANIYFPLAEQFRTQSEPAYCGLSTLVMVLNALAVDPKRVWRGAWRWYHEEMLDCCLSLDVVQQQGITMEQFICLATCNNLDINTVRITDDESIEDFRNVVKRICSGGGQILTCSYSRRVLGQTGDGHFSPIGAYNEEKDMVLILDVARFKYPPHWITVDLMWNAMKALDKTTGHPRGYIIMRKTQEMPLLLFRLSNTFRVTIATEKLSSSNMAKFLKSWKEFLKMTDCCGVCENLEDAVTYALKSLNESLAALFEEESVFTTQFNTCCIDVLPTEHVDGVEKLLKSIESLKIYEVVKNWFANFKFNNQGVVKPKSMCRCSSRRSRISRVGVSYSKRPEYYSENESNSTDHSVESSCRNKGENLVTQNHYVTMLLLSWPYPQHTQPGYVCCLYKYVEDSMKDCEEILDNEVRQLKQQINSLILMVKSYDNA